MSEKWKAWLAYNQAGLAAGALFGATFDKIVVEFPTLVKLFDFPAKLFSTLTTEPTIIFVFNILFYAILGASIQSKIRRTKIV